MQRIDKVIPNPDVLLSLAPEELAPIVLKLAASRMQGGMVQLEQIITAPVGAGFSTVYEIPYPPAKEREVRVALSEAWQWLILNLLDHACGRRQRRPRI